MTQLMLSVVIPARDEEGNIPATLEDLHATLCAGGMPFEIVVVDDNSRDHTAATVREFAEGHHGVVLLSRKPPAGFGRAVRDGVQAVAGDCVVVYMADRSDHPQDVLTYYDKLCEGWDCVFGSRFIRGSSVSGYPLGKRLLNRLANTLIRVMFWTSCNDMTNAFKGYRRHVLRECGSFQACHFNITLEMPLAALIRGYTYAVVPISWEGRTSGVSRFNVRTLARRYLSTLLKCYFEYRLVRDDLVADVLSHKRAARHPDLERRLEDLEARIDKLEGKSGKPAGGDRT